MKRCKSDDLSPDEEGGRTGLSAVCEDAPSVLIVEVKHEDTPDSSSAGGTANSHSTARSKPPDLKVIKSHFHAFFKLSVARLPLEGAAAVN